MKRCNLIHNKLIYTDDAGVSLPVTPPSGPPPLLRGVVLSGSTVWSCPIWTKQPVAHYSEGLSHPILSISEVRSLYFLSAGVYPISQDAPQQPPHPFSYAVMNDHWPSHWQLGSWCHIITVSPFRQNYQITSVLKRPRRLTGQPTNETQISKKRKTLKTLWIIKDRHFVAPPPFFLALRGHQL